MSVRTEAAGSCEAADVFAAQFAVLARDGVEVGRVGKATYGRQGGVRTLGAG